MRTRDADLVNRIANHPAVRPHIGASGQGEIDFTAVVADDANVCVELEHGVMLFVPKGPGVYELHTLITPEGRGSAVLPAAHKAFGFMFSNGCEVLLTFAPASNRPAALMARRAGFKATSVEPNAWEDGSDVTHFRLTRAEWSARHPEAS